MPLTLKKKKRKFFNNVVKLKLIFMKNKCIAKKQKAIAHNN